MANIWHENGKVYIEGVRKVSWDTGEMSEFAASLVSALQTLGDPIPYSEIMAASGSSFRFTIYPGEWDFTNYSFLNIAADPLEPARRAIAAALRLFHLSVRFLRGGCRQNHGQYRTRRTGAGVSNRRPV